MASLAAQETASTEVKKLIPLQYDLGLLMAHDISHSLDASMATQSKEAFEESLKVYTRDNAQLLLNALFSLPLDTDPNEDGAVFVRLPEPLMPLPRAKPVPAEKPKTTWQKFAEKKGIQKTKRSAKVFDEASGEYKARHGAKSKKNDPLADWCTEDPTGPTKKFRKGGRPIQKSKK